jgi:hypothetical protein
MCPRHDATQGMAGRGGGMDTHPFCTKSRYMDSEYVRDSTRIKVRNALTSSPEGRMSRFPPPPPFFPPPFFFPFFPFFFRPIAGFHALPVGRGGAVGVGVLAPFVFLVRKLNRKSREIRRQKGGWAVDSRQDSDTSSGRVPLALFPCHLPLPLAPIASIASRAAQDRSSEGIRKGRGGRGRGGKVAASWNSHHVSPSWGPGVLPGCSLFGLSVDRQHLPPPAPAPAPPASSQDGEGSSSSIQDLPALAYYGATTALLGHSGRASARAGPAPGRL